MRELAVTINPAQRLPPGRRADAGEKPQRPDQRGGKERKAGDSGPSGDVQPKAKPRDCEECAEDNEQRQKCGPQPFPESGESRAQDECIQNGAGSGAVTGGQIVQQRLPFSECDHRSMQSGNRDITDATGARRFLSL